MIPNVDHEAREEWAAIRARDHQRRPLPVTDTPPTPPVVDERFEDIPSFRKLVPYGHRRITRMPHKKGCYSDGQLDCSCQLRHGPRKEVH